MIVDFNELQIITVSFNHSTYLDNYFQSFINVFGTIPCSLYMADNDSSDDSLDILLKWRDKYPKQIFIKRNKQNFGFSKANNILAKESNSKYILFLNPDISFDHDFLTPCLNHIKDKKICFSPSFIDLKLNKNYKNFDSFYDSPLYSIKKVLSKFIAPPLLKVDWIQAASLFLHRKHFEKAGGFNEQYFVYTEDMHLGKTLNQLGVLSFIDNNIKVFHPYREISKKQNQYMIKNLKKYHKEYPIYPYLFHNLLMRLFLFKDIDLLTLWKGIRDEV